MAKDMMGDHGGMSSSLGQMPHKEVMHGTSADMLPDMNEVIDTMPCLDKVCGPVSEDNEVDSENPVTEAKSELAKK